MPDPILELHQLSKNYNSLAAVKNVSLSVSRGEIFGFLGPNGAGKTTTIRMITGLVHPSSGSVRICGWDIQSNFLDAIRKIGALVETAQFYPFLSAYQNLGILSRLSKLADGKKRIGEVLDIVGLTSRRKDKVETYSQGMRQRLGIAQAILARPELIILDEPTNGLDPGGMEEIRKLITRLAKENSATIFLSSHNLFEVEQICDRVGILNNGVLIAEGKIESLMKGKDRSLEELFFRLTKEDPQT